MPRKPTSPVHPLRAIRIACGKTQRQFAEMLGVSRETVLSVELRRLKMPSDLALKVRVETGCLLSEDRTAKGKRTFDVRAIAADTLKPYTAQDFLNHREAMDSFYGLESGELIVMIQGATRAIDLIMHASQRRGGQVMLGFVKDLENFLVKAFESFALESSLAGYITDQFGRDANGKVVSKSFPLAPLSTAFSFVSSVEGTSNSGQKVMPK